MGQMTFALMLGCKMPEAPKGKTWWGDSEQVNGEWVYQDGLLEIYKPGRGMDPKTDEQGEVIGFFVAAGASGKDGIPDLVGPIDLAAVEQTKPYAKVIKRARKSWERFAVFCGKQGVVLTEPRLWLVETEVA